MKFILYLFISFFYFSFCLQAQNINWAINPGGSLTGTNDLDESGTIVLNDAAGNVINIGNFKGTVDMDPSAAIVNLTSASANQISTYMAKYDTNKNLIWAKKLDDVNALNLSDKGIDYNGNFYIAGSSTVATNFNTSGGSTIFPYSSANNGESNYYIAKYDSNGNLVWVNNFPGAYKFTLDVSNNLYVYGYLNGATDLDIKATQLILTPQNYAAYYFAKYDQSLTILLAKKIELGTAVGNDGYAEVGAIVTDNTNIFLCGNYQGTVDFDPSTTIYNLPYYPVSTHRNDPYFAKYDATGSFLWAKSITTNGEHAFNHALVDASGNLYISGITNATALDFDPSAATFSYTGGGNSDTYMAKYDGTGSFLWANYFLNLSSFSIALGAQNIYLHALNYPNIDLDPSPTQTYSINMVNNCIAAYSKTTGTLNWATTIGGSNQITNSVGLQIPLGGSISIDAQENVFATGCYYPVPGNTVSDFDPTPNQLLLTLNGNNTDAFLTKYSPLSLNFITNKAAYCQGETITVTFTPFGYYSSGNQYTFLLSDASGSFASPTTLSVQTTSVAGSFTYSLPGNITGGTGYKIRMSSSNPSTVPVIDKSITINTNPIIPVISGSASVCGNASGKIYSITPHTGSTYLWTAPSNTLINGSAVNASAVLNFTNYTATGNFTVTETNVNGCGSAQANFAIAPLAVPATSSIVGSNFICSNATGKIYSVTNTTGSNYAWNVPANIFIDGAQDLNNISVHATNFNTSVTIKVTETNGLGCIGLPVNFIVNPLSLPVTSAISGSTNICGNATGKGYSVSNTSGSSYAWSIAGGGIVASGQTTSSSTINFSNFTSGTISVTETNTNSCVGVPVFLAISSLATPVTSSISGATGLCGNASLIPYSVTTHTGTTYAWSAPSGIVINSANGNSSISVSCNNYVTSGSITVTETNTTSGCVGSPISALITAYPVPNKTMIGTASVCSNAKGVTYSIPATAGSTYSWILGSGMNFNGPFTGNSVVLDFNNFVTPVALQVKETTVNGCVALPYTKLNLTSLSIPPAFTISGSTVNCTTGTYYYSVPNYSDYSYQWTLPSNALVDNPNNLPNPTSGPALYMHFSDNSSGALKLTETLLTTGCTQVITLPILAKPQPVITGPSVACSQFGHGDFSTPIEASGATYYWNFPSSMSAVGNRNQPNVQLLFSNFTKADDISVDVNLNGCQITAYTTVSPKTSPNLPSIVGPDFSCLTATTNLVPYQLNHTNAGHGYLWSTSNYIQIVDNPTEASATLDLSQIVAQSSAGVLTASEIDLSDNCIVAQIQKTITGYTNSLYVSGERSFCDLTKNYTYSVSNPDPANTFHWASVANTNILSGITNSTVNLNFNTATAAKFSVTQSNTLGCQTAPSIVTVGYINKQYNILPVKISCANTSYALTLSKALVKYNLNKVELSFTYNPAYASLSATPYTNDKVSTSSGLASIVVTETIPGQIKLTISANNGQKLYLLDNFISINFDINHANMNDGDINSIVSTSIQEYLLDGSIENCNTFSSTVTKITPSSTLLGNLIYCNSTSVPLTYNSSIPSQYLITNISGTSALDCSGLSNAVQPDLLGNFSYSLNNGSNLNIHRDIASSTQVSAYINADDAAKIYSLINGADPFDRDNFYFNIYTLLAADVNRDGKITADDYQQVMDRSTGLRTTFATADANQTATPDWSFIDKYSTDNSAPYLFKNLFNNYLIDAGSGKLKINPAKSIPIVPSCLPIRLITNGSCSEAQPETYQGILSGDVAANPFSSIGRFGNAPNSKLRIADVNNSTADIVCDLSMAETLPNNKFKFPIYVFAADTAESLDFHLNYDQTKMTIDAVENSSAQVNENFIFSYYNNNQDILQVSGFGPQKLLSNVPILYVTVTVTTGALSKNLLGTFETALINGNPVEGKIIDGTTTPIVKASNGFAGIYLYPNPTTDVLHIAGLQNPQAFTSVSLLNSLGVELTNCMTNKEQIEVSSLSAGVYYVKITVNGNDTMFRFVKL